MYTGNLLGITPGRHAGEDPVDIPPDYKVAKEPSHKLVEVSGEVFYSLGALYKYVGIPFDLISQFLEDFKLNILIKAYAFNHEPFQGLNEWSNILYSMPIEHSVLFNKWMLGQVFNQSQVQETWQVKGKQILLLDPGAIHLRDTNDIRHVKVIAFVPYSNKREVSIIPIDDMGSAYRFVTKSPDASLPRIDLSKI